MTKTESLHGVIGVLNLLSDLLENGSDLQTRVALSHLTHARDLLASDLKPLAPVDSEPREISQHELTTMAARLLRLRRRRDQVFADGLFGEPAWDILLYLYARSDAKVRVTIGDACSASHVGGGRAVRCIDRLVDERLIERRPDPKHGRRIFVQLTDAGRSKIIETLTEPKPLQ